MILPKSKQNPGNLVDPFLGNLIGTYTIGTLGTLTWEPLGPCRNLYIWQPLLGNLCLGTLGEWVLGLLRPTQKPLLWLKIPKLPLLGKKTSPGPAFSRSSGCFYRGVHTVFTWFTIWWQCWKLQDTERWLDLRRLLPSLMVPSCSTMFEHGTVVNCLSLGKEGV